MPASSAFSASSLKVRGKRSGRYSKVLRLDADGVANLMGPSDISSARNDAPEPEEEDEKRRLEEEGVCNVSPFPAEA